MAATAALQTHNEAALAATTCWSARVVVLLVGLLRLRCPATPVPPALFVLLFHGFRPLDAAKMAHAQAALDQLGILFEFVLDVG